MCILMAEIWSRPLNFRLGCALDLTFAILVLQICTRISPTIISLVASAGISSMLLVSTVQHKESVTFYRYEDLCKICCRIQHM